MLICHSPWKQAWFSPNALEDLIVAFAERSFHNGRSTRGFGWHILYRITILWKMIQKHLERFGISVVRGHPQKTRRAMEDGIFEFRAEIGLDREIRVCGYIHGRLKCLIRDL